MRPEIRYARTTDGLNIAFWSIGSGPVLIDIPMPPGEHVEKIWDVTEYEDFFTGLAKRFTYVKYDARGFGLSERRVARFSVEAMVLDLEAVVEALGLQRIVLNGWMLCSIIAIAYAARHPEQVIALILRDGMAHGATRDRAFEDLLALARSDWEATTRVYADNVTNVRRIASQRQIRDMIATTSTQDAFVRFTEAWHDWDVSPMLAQVLAPALVTNDGTFVPRAESERVAAALPRGSFAGQQQQRGEVSPTEEAAEAFLGRVLAAEFPRPHSEKPHTAGSADGVVRAGLTPRELQVLQLVAAGRSSRQIAHDLIVSERTVVRHIANIYTKIDAHGRAEATAYAVRHGLA